MRQAVKTGFSVGRGLTALAAIAVFATPVAAEHEKSHLEAVERALARDQAKVEALERESAAIRADIRALQQELIVAARRTQDLEQRLSESEERLAELEAAQAEKLKALDARHEQWAETLAALQRLALQPPEAQLVVPESPLDSLRSALLLGTAVPAIEQRIAKLRVDLDELRVLRAEIAREREELGVATAALQSERLRLTEMIDRKKALRTSVTAEQVTARERAKHLAAEADNLRDLMERLEREAREAEERAAREAAAQAALEAERLAREAGERAAREAEAQAALEAERMAREAKAQAALEAEQAAQEAEEAQESAVAAVEERADGNGSTAAPGVQEARLSLAPQQVILARPANVRPFPDSPSIASLILPARGSLVLRYGQRRDGDDEASKGITIATRAAAQVVAPFDGKVAFAGLFRGYGQILIIEHGGRYHSLLAGLERIDAVLGQWLLAGEPVGVMGGAPGDRPELYVELRRTGRPINPLPWLATTSDKVQG